MKDESLPLIPPSDHGQSRDEIAAEIADHLAAAEAELAKSGSAPEEARAAARKKFGDVEKIQKTCYWIQNGETIMLRWSLICLAAALCILLGLSVLGNWRTQSQLAEQVGKLSEELKAMAAAKQSPPPAPQPPEITGVIYSGSKDKPLAERRVAIRRADGAVVRRIVSDQNGVFHSGPLEAGDYCVTSPVLDPPQSLASIVAQSGPIFLHSGSGNFSRDLDVAYHSGTIKIVASRPLPEIRKEGSYLIKSRLSVDVLPSRHQWGLWTPAQDDTAVWPIYCYAVVSDAARNGRVTSRDRFKSAKALELDQKQSAELRDAMEVTRFPAGKTEIAIALSLAVIPIDEKGDVVLLRQRIQEFPQLHGSLRNMPSKQFLSVPWSKIEEADGWRVISGGGTWIEHLAGTKSYEAATPESPPYENLEIRENQVAVLQVEIPADVELEVQNAVDSTPDLKEFIALARKGLLQRPLKIVKTNYEPMSK